MSQGFFLQGKEFVLSREKRILKRRDKKGRILQKTGIRPTTRAGHKTVVNVLAKEEFGKRVISSIKVSDAKE